MKPIVCARASVRARGIAFVSVFVCVCACARVYVWESVYVCVCVRERAKNERILLSSLLGFCKLWPLAHRSVSLTTLQLGRSWLDNILLNHDHNMVIIILIIIIIITIIRASFILIIIITMTLKGAIQDFFFAIFSLCRELSPLRTLKWPWRNRVQIFGNTSGAFLMQGGVYHVVRRDNLAINMTDLN